MVVVLISAPTFWRMLAPGIYSMQDFHLFRLYEFDKCVRSLQIPCRWAPDAGLGYGEPLFNFYGQVSYAVGELMHVAGFSLIDSLKLAFIISIIASGVAMYFLARKIWKSDLAGFVSAVLYIYAPYRAVDVWVRGALPEAFGFVLFPLIILAIEEKNTVWFSFLSALLILTHNLSAFMFFPMILIWIIYRKFWKGIASGIFALAISAFYILPVIFESRFINLTSTIQGYFDFRAHFITFNQIFISRFWGYGGSTWGDGDGLSLSLGQIQWVLPLLALMLIFFKKKLKDYKEFLILLVLGFFFLFLTHNKSTFLWESLPFMAYIQFPWRFLGIATFCFAVSGGAIISIFEKGKLWVALTIILVAIILNFSFFREDIWYKVNDSYFTSGAEWDRQRTASIGDFWPNFGHKIPNKPSDGRYINYFPGWVGATPDKNGLIPSEGVTFTDTPIRKVGNIISLVLLLVLFIYSIKLWRKEA